MRNNPHSFDREKVTQHVEERVNELWQDMVSITSGQRWITSLENVSRDEAIEAAMILRGQLAQALWEIGNLCGTAGEHLEPKAYIQAANKTFREVVVPQCREINCPPARFVAPHADPNWRMAQVVLRIWDSQFFKPQRGNAATMVAGMVAAAKSNREAARPASRLLKRLRKSKLKGYENRTERLLSEVVEFLQVYMPEEARQVVDDASIAEAHSQKHQSPEKEPRSETPREKRDKWIYGECMKGTAYQTIAIRLKKKPKSWPRIESVNGIKQAAHRHAKRYSLREPPARQSGCRPG